MAVAATGFFDGVHLGHRNVVGTLLRIASEREEQSLVLTFWPHPRTVLKSGARDLRLLNSQEEKIGRLRGMGVDRVEVLPFTRGFAAMTAEQYLHLLVSDYGVSAIVLGHDNRFGSDRLSTAQIVALARSMSVDAFVVGPESCGPAGDGQVIISSTEIRNALGKGEVGRAARMLGYDYELSGVVVSGNMMGRTIGFPTANMKLREPLKCLPASGAYITEVWVDGREFKGMTNIDASGKIETHILDFHEDIYGMDIRISFSSKLRDELRFSSFAALKDQLLKDIEVVRQSK